MGRRIFPLVLAVLLLLAGCRQEKPEESTRDGVSAGSVPIELEPPDTTADGKLLFADYASFTGGYMEDGTGDMVENVAAVLVENLSDEYLEYASLTFEIEGKQAVFEVTGLTAGDAAWVLEKNRLQIDPDADFRFVTSSCGYLQDVTRSRWELMVTMSDGVLTARNNSEKAMHNVYVYYKRVHEDGNYFGGITYRCDIGSLESGEQKEAVAGHSSAQGCRIVKIEWNWEEQTR